jgi:hypothetical protein
MVAPAGSTSTRAAVSGPTSRGIAPIRQCSSTPPVGRWRWTYGSGPVRCTQTVRTRVAKERDGIRST